MDESPSPREAGRLPLVVESVRWNRTDSGILLRIAGTWMVEPPIDLPAPVIELGDPARPLRYEALGGTSDATARAAKGPRAFRAAFALAVEQVPLLAESVRLDLGFGALPLPDPEPPEGEAPPKRTVVDSAEMAERRARRAEAAQMTTAQRAEEAEAAVEALEIELAQMEVRMREVSPPAEPASAATLSPLAADLAELRDLVARAEQAAHSATDQTQQRARTLAREIERAHAAPASPLVSPASKPPVAAPLSPVTGALLDAERRHVEARARPDAAQPAVDQELTHLLSAEVVGLKTELAAARAAIARPEPGIADVRAELDRQREAGRQLAAQVAAGTLELRDALVALTVERDEARRQAERLSAEIARINRSTEARERAWDAANELAREAVAAASQAVTETEARAAGLERDLAEGAVALERAQTLIARLQEALAAATTAAAATATGPAEAEVQPEPAPAAPEEPEPALDPAPAASPWLGRALTDLRRNDDKTALDLLLGLFAAQGIEHALPEAFDLHVAGRDPLRVVPRSSGGATVRPRRENEPPARLSLEASTHQLALLLTGELRRRLRVRGPLRARRALRKSLGPVPLDIADLAVAGVRLPPRALYAALMQRFDPEWFGAHELVVEQDITGPRGDRWFVVLSDGKLELRDELPEGKDAPDAVVRGSQVAFAHVLSGRPPPEGERVTLRGDRLALALLTQWTERARTRP